MAAFDLLGRRWAMGIIWNLDRGPATFRALQKSCETISPSILNSRLKELREAELIDRSLDGYILTPIGKELFSLLKPLGAWSVNWAKQIVPDEHNRWDTILKDKEK